MVTIAPCVRLLVCVALTGSTTPHSPRWLLPPRTTGDCPRGDDPKTVDDVVEVQLIKCTASSGTFRLSFRQALSPTLSYDVTPEALKDALEIMDTINGVSIEYTLSSDASTPLCSAAGLNVAIVTFTQDFGDLPNLILASDGLTPTDSVRCPPAIVHDGRCAVLTG